MPDPDVTVCTTEDPPLFLYEVQADVQNPIYRRTADAQSTEAGIEWVRAGARFVSSADGQRLGPCRLVKGGARTLRTTAFITALLEASKQVEPETWTEHAAVRRLDAPGLDRAVLNHLFASPIHRPHLINALTDVDRQIDSLLAGDGRLPVADPVISADPTGERSRLVRVAAAMGSAIIGDMPAEKKVQAAVHFHVFGRTSQGHEVDPEIVVAIVDRTRALLAEKAAGRPLRSDNRPSTRDIPQSGGFLGEGVIFRPTGEDPLAGSGVFPGDEASA